MFIADMHCDSLLRVRSDRGLVTQYNFSQNHAQLQFAAAFIPKDERDCNARIQELIKYYNVYLAEVSRLGLVDVRGSFDLDFAIENERRSTLFSIEGGAGLLADSSELDMLFGLGLRVLGLVWDGNELSASAWDRIDTGLTSEGVKMVKRCLELGISVDVSHMSDKAFYQTLEASGAPVLATHSNFRSLCRSPRNLTDEMARMIVERGGVIGLNLLPEFLRDGGGATADDILRHVDYALEHFGEYSLGFGFDIDGTDGKYPIGITTDRSIHEQVIELLLPRYSASTVERIAGKNVTDFLMQNLSV